MTAIEPRIRRGFALGLLGSIALRLLGGALLLLVISVLVFSLVYIAPGDIVTNLLGPQNRSPEAIAAVTERYRLGDPPVQQYLAWLGNALTGDWGVSFRQQAPVASILADRAGVTLSLVGLAFVLAVVAAVPLGILAATRPGGWRDQLAGAVTVFGISAPSFVVSFLLMLAFASAVRWFPLYGYGDGGLDTLRHLILPATALAIGLGAVIAKITRTVMVRELAEEYVTSARARGWSERRVLTLALRNAAIPIVTSAGLVVTYLVAGTILVETVFALPGLGRLLYDAVLYKDIPTVQAATLLIAAVIIVVSIVVDLLYVALDPRVRREGTAA